MSSIFIKFYDGQYLQFDECKYIEFTYGTVTIFDDDIPFVYKEDEIKEMIFVNDYTLLHAIEQGYNL